MSAVNKLLKKKQEKHQQQPTQPQGNVPSQHQQPVSSAGANTPNSPMKGQSFGSAYSPSSFTPMSNNPNYQYQYDKKLQSQYQKYSQYGQANSYNSKFSHAFFPNSVTTYNKAKIPLLCFTEAVNSDFDCTRTMQQRSATKVPRCNYCRAYMNCYNQIRNQKNTTYYKCFFCQKENSIDLKEYNPYKNQENTKLQIDQNLYELSDPNFRMLGAENVFNTSPPQNVLIFMVDISNAAFHCKMLYYTVTVMKDILSRQQYNQTVIYFYTYDDTVHQYDFSGKQVKCTVLDGSIVEPNVRFNQTIGDIRQKLFDMLDSLEEVSQRNQKQGSNFISAFGYVFESIKHTAGKMFIFQANEAMASEPMTQQVSKDPKTQETIQTQPMRKSLLEPINKLFFNKFVAHMLATNISCSMFIFTKLFKNIRVLSDTFKLTNSELNIYYKDSPEELNKFYYDFYYLLGANYFTDVRMQLIIVPGWYFTAVYGNLYRLKQFISFKLCHLDPSKKVCLAFMPQQSQPSPPYFAIQLVSNFFHQRKHYLQVNTLVIPITNSAQKIYNSIDCQMISAGIIKTAMSSLRLQQLSLVKNKILKSISSFWNSANSYYKKNPPPQIRGVVLTILGFLKSPHSQIDLINNTPILDRVVQQRNLLQSCGHFQISNFFSPYLFSISTMSPEMCRDDQDFCYPQIVQLKFGNVRDGVYLMDAGLYMYLFIAKQCDPRLLKDLFGKQKFLKGQVMYEDNLRSDTVLGEKIGNLIRVLRQQKSYGWIPLYVVRCGQGSNHERSFYMHFYAEKYDEFKAFKINEQQFTNMLEQQYA